MLSEVVCAPSSGTGFFVGSNLVTCMAMDNSLNVATESFVVTIVTSDGDGDGILDFVDENKGVPSDDFTDVDLYDVTTGLYGVTTGSIQEHGDQFVRVSDGDGGDVGVTLFAKSGDEGINDDDDCQDANGNIFFGNSTDATEDLCFDADGNTLPEFNILNSIDEDPINGIDDDGDGLVDEDPGLTNDEDGDGLFSEHAEINACDAATIFLDGGEAVNITCGSVTIEVFSGPVDVAFTAGGVPITTTLDAGETLTYDPETLTITAGPTTTAIINVYGVPTTILPDGIIDVNPSLQDQKSEQITILESIDGESKQTQKEIDKAIEKIEKSLDDKFWKDEITLDSKKGHQVFDNEKDAIKNLMKTLGVNTGGDDDDDDDKKKKYVATDDAKPIIQGVIDTLVQIDRTLAQDAIDNSEKSNLNKANSEIAKGDGKSSQGKPDKAIDHYKKAWKHAQDSKKSGDNDDDDDDDDEDDDDD